MSTIVESMMPILERKAREGVEVTKERYDHRSLVIRVKEQCCRLLSPLL